MQNKFYTILFFSLFTSILNAQTFELGVFAGTSAYNGDLTHTLIDLHELHPAFGIEAALPLNSHFAIKAQANALKISGDDANSNKPAFLARNLNFSSSLLETGLMFDFFILGFNPEQKSYFSPFISIGAMLFHFNPKTEYDGVIYELQPLGTEGQGTSAFPDRKPYKLTQISIPISVGIKYAFSTKMYISFAFTGNKTFTDYLDDVSKTYVEESTLISENGIMAFELSNRTDEYLNSEPLPYNTSHKRGNSSISDWYGSFGITLSYCLGKTQSFTSGKASSLNCPKFSL